VFRGQSDRATDQVMIGEVHLIVDLPTQRVVCQRRGREGDVDDRISSSGLEGWFISCV
jgi:hypothetical protein